MSYATVNDIESEFKNITFGSTPNTLTSDEVTEFISQEEAIIDAAISNRYTVPLTGTEALKIAKSISIAFVAYRVAKVLNLKKDVRIPENFTPQTLNSGTSLKRAKTLLSDIQSGKVVLNDAVARSAGQGVQSYNATNNICPVWERDTAQW